MIDKELMRNASGYYDPTAYDAMKNMKGDDEMDLYKGDIFEIELANGNIREAIILSVHDSFSTILMLTENERLPYKVICKGVKYTDPGMVQYAFNDKFKSYIRSMSEQETNELLKSVVDGLGYEAPAKMIAKVETKVDPKPIIEKVQSEELTKAQAERDVYKSLYENLLNSMISK